MAFGPGSRWSVKALKAWTANLLLLSASLAASCGTAELYLRWFRPQPLEASYRWPDGTLRNIASLDYVYTRGEFSNRVRFNAQGLRGPEIPAGRTPGVPRVVVLGDSFVEGRQVSDDDVATEVMRRRAAGTGLTLEVINAGIGGYGTGEELILWRKLARAFRPDLVLVGFYPNDIRNNIHRKLFEVIDGVVTPRRPPRAPRHRWLYDLQSLLASRSHLFMLCQLGIDRLQEEDAATPGEAEEAFQRVPSPEIDAGWDLTLALLGQLGREVEAEGARFAVVVFPTRFQVDDQVMAAHARSAGLDPNDLDLRAPQRRFAEWSARTGVPTIDLLDGFRARNRSNTFYYTIDAHWNRQGQHLAGELMLDELMARGLLGRPGR
jgi:hypothetical protein